MASKHESVLDYIQRMVALGKDYLSKAEWTRIRNNGTPDEIQEAVDRMMAQGGYENLE